MHQLQAREAELEEATTGGRGCGLLVWEEGQPSRRRPAAHRGGLARPSQPRLPAPCPIHAELEELRSCSEARLQLLEEARAEAAAAEQRGAAALEQAEHVQAEVQAAVAGYTQQHAEIAQAVRAALGDVRPGSSVARLLATLLGPEEAAAAAEDATQRWECKRQRRQERQERRQRRRQQQDEAVQQQDEAVQQQEVQQEDSSSRNS